MNQLHPFISEILAAHGMPQHDPIESRLAVYVVDLLRHDWECEHSADQRVWSAGRAELRRLRAEQAAIDPQATLWNANCPPAYRIATQ